MKKNKKIMLGIIVIVTILMLSITLTYAIFSYANEGTKTVTLSGGTIKFEYKESQTKKINVDGLPSTDDSGKVQDEYFEFTISSDTSLDASIPYKITARKNDPGNAAGLIKVYLTKVTNGVETQVLLSNYSNLVTEVHNGRSEQVLHLDQVPAENNTYNQVYRLRMWIDNDEYFNSQNTSHDGETFSITVNVYTESEAL